MKRKSKLPYGYWKWPEYLIWGQIIQRCNNPKNKQYADYGGRGIRICKRWMNFENFYADMGKRPNKKLQIDRVNNNAGYTPKNCKWRTQIENNRNRRNAIYVVFRGEKISLLELSNRTGIPKDALRRRIFYSNYSIEEAATIPCRYRNRWEIKKWAR